MWQVEFTNEFEAWWSDLDETAQEAVRVGVEKLTRGGPGLGRPHADTVHGSKHPNMKELRAQSMGRPIRVFFAFDPRRAAILLIGGDKTGDRRFYERMVPIADGLYDVYLEELREEGLI